MLHGFIIIIKRTGDDGSKYPVTESEVKIGTSADCRIRINTPVVSSEHCLLIVADNGRVSVKNLSTTYPTVVNSLTLLGETSLNHGDVLEIGGRLVRWEYLQGSPHYRHQKQNSPNLAKKRKTLTSIPADPSLRVKTPTVKRLSKGPIALKNASPRKSKTPRTPKSATSAKRTSLPNSGSRSVPRKSQMFLGRKSLQATKLLFDAIDNDRRANEASSGVSRKTPTKRRVSTPIRASTAGQLQKTSDLVAIPESQSAAPPSPDAASPLLSLKKTPKSTKKSATPRTQTPKRTKTPGKAAMKRSPKTPASAKSRKSMKTPVKPAKSPKSPKTPSPTKGQKSPKTPLSIRGRKSPKSLKTPSTSKSPKSPKSASTRLSKTQRTPKKTPKKSAKSPQSEIVESPSVSLSPESPQVRKRSASSGSAVPSTPPKTPISPNKATISILAPLKISPKTPKSPKRKESLSESETGESPKAGLPLNDSVSLFNETTPAASPKKPALPSTPSTPPVDVLRSPPSTTSPVFKTPKVPPPKRSPKSTPKRNTPKKSPRSMQESPMKFPVKSPLTPTFKPVTIAMHPHAIPTITITSPSPQKGPLSTPKQTHQSAIIDEVSEEGFYGISATKASEKTSSPRYGDPANNSPSEHPSITGGSSVCIVNHVSEAAVDSSALLSINVEAVRSGIKRKLNMGLNVVKAKKMKPSPQPDKNKKKALLLLMKPNKAKVELKLKQKIVKKAVKITNKPTLQLPKRTVGRKRNLPLKSTVKKPTTAIQSSEETVEVVPDDAAIPPARSPGKQATPAPPSPRRSGRDFSAFNIDSILDKLPVQAEHFDRRSSKRISHKNYTGRPDFTELSPTALGLTPRVPYKTPSKGRRSISLTTPRNAQKIGIIKAASTSKKNSRKSVSFSNGTKDVSADTSVYATPDISQDLFVSPIESISSTQGSVSPASPKRSLKGLHLLSSVAGKRGRVSINLINFESPLSTPVAKAGGASLEESVPTDIFDIVTSERSPSNVVASKAVKRLSRSPKVQKSPKNDLTNKKGAKKVKGTPRPQKSPKNDLRDIKGVKKLLATPKQQKSPKNDLTNVRGLKKLLTTPKQQKSPKNDLTNIRGLKKLMTTPKQQRSPKNDLTNIRGVKKLMATPKQQKSPKNDLTNVKGVKKLMASPKVQKSPKNDLTNIRGVKKLLTTPKQQRSPKNDLTNVGGVKKLMATPKVQKSPKNDLTNIRGVKKLLKTPKQQKSPKNDLTNVRGLKKLMGTPKQQRSPKNDLTNVRGLKKLMATPKQQKSPKNDLTNVKGLKKLMTTPKQQKSPKNDLTNVRGLKKLMTTPKVQKSPRNDLTNVSGLKKLMASPKPRKSPKNNLLDVEGVERLMSTPKPQNARVGDLSGVAKKSSKFPLDLIDISAVVASPSPKKIVKRVLVVPDAQRISAEQDVSESRSPATKRARAAASPSTKVQKTAAKGAKSKIPVRSPVYASDKESDEPVKLAARRTQRGAAASPNRTKSPKTTRPARRRKEPEPTSPTEEVVEKKSTRGRKRIVSPESTAQVPKRGRSKFVEVEEEKPVVTKGRKLTTTSPGPDSQKKVGRQRRVLEISVPDVVSQEEEPPKRRAGRPRLNSEKAATPKKATRGAKKVSSSEEESSTKVPRSRATKAAKAVSPEKPVTARRGRKALVTQPSPKSSPPKLRTRSRAKSSTPLKRKK